MNKSIIPKILVIIVVTALLGEFRISPFDSSFRFGLGSAGFFFLLLFYKDIPYRLTGLITGFFTTFFRIGLDYVSVDSFSFFSSLQTHMPIIGYYFTFAILLELIRRKNFSQNPLLLGLFGALCDAFSNFMEIAIILTFVSSNFTGSFEKLTFVMIVAIVRSFFVVGLFTMFQANKLNAVFQEQQVRFEQVQTILSGLYIEGFYLRKTLSDIERVTAKGHRLYRDLKELQPQNNLSTLALTVAQELHEVKKDNQRILSGLEKVIRYQNSKMPNTLSEIIDLSMKANQKYSDYLKKDIEISSNQLCDIRVKTVYPLLVIINNLVANAIEAISNKGYIKIISKNELDMLMIEIIDNGVGIDKDEQAVIFEPGYTTKFDETGVASTGIGLSHVQSMVHELGGTISVESDNSNTIFKVHLPVSKIIVKE